MLPVIQVRIELKVEAPSLDRLVDVLEDILDDGIWEQAEINLAVGAIRQAAADLSSAVEIATIKGE